MTIKTLLVALNSIALLSAFVWLYLKPDWEPFITSIGLIGTLITLIFIKDKSNGGQTTMKQRGGKNSTNIQANGDLNIHL